MKSTGPNWSDRSIRSRGGGEWLFARFSRLPAVLALILGLLGSVPKGVIGDDSDGQAWGSIHGRVTVSGQLPKIENERIPAGQATCAAGGLGLPDDNLKISSTRGLADVFVVLHAISPDAPLRIHPDLADPPPGPATIEFFNCRIRPHAILVRCGQPIQLINRDSVGHLCRIQTLNNELYLKMMHVSRSEIRFDQADPVPGSIHCDIHRWMDGVILVRDDPYAALTDEEGRFELKQVPVGHWRLGFWHRRAGYLSSLDTDVGPVDQRGCIEIDVPADHSLDLGQLTFPAGEFRQTLAGKKR